jgi:hypothetical protein
VFTIIYRTEDDRESNITAELGEGPWATREEAELFAKAEVLNPLRVVACDADGRVLHWNV